MSLMDPLTIARSASWDLLHEDLAADVQISLCNTPKSDVVFADGTSPLAIFRHAVATAIGRIHEDGRLPLFHRFLKDGPYVDAGEISAEQRARYLTDEETANVIRFTYSHMVNCFKGALAELLAVGPCMRILRKMQARKRLPLDARLYVGDAIMSRQMKGDAFAKGADLHILRRCQARRESPTVAVSGVVEVKSYFQSEERFRRQLNRHVARARRGLRAGKDVFEPDHVIIGHDLGGSVAWISVQPAWWQLPRSFCFKTEGEQRFLHVDPPVPPKDADEMEQIGPNEWRVILRWSKEALDAAGYDMTFWFMEKVGEALYANSVPPEWKPMTPAQAGQNAAKQALYYAILRARTLREDQRAIALYNSYGFGCSLGLNFRNNKGKREMLWPEDLDEILANGRNKDGSKIV